MSLTSFLKSSDVHERFKTEFLMPPFGEKEELGAPPRTQNRSLVGTAFDYLLRFYIGRLNPKSETRKWVAEDVALQYDYLKIDAILANAKNYHSQYIASGKMDDRLIKTALYLAQLDVLHRSGDDSYYDTAGRIDLKDVRDLRRLISLIQPEMFTAKKLCLLNPTFGSASQLVGGADCDLVIDDAIIEIKTTKDLKVTRAYLHQLIGYYILFRIGGIDGLPKSRNIRRLGIYFSRQGCLWLFKIQDVSNKRQLPKITSWFKKRAKRNGDFHA